MASSELNVGNIDGVEILTPLKDQCLPPLSNTPMDFSLLTTSQLGISPQSFTPSSGRKGKAFSKSETGMFDLRRVIK